MIRLSTSETILLILNKKKTYAFKKPLFEGIKKGFNSYEWHNFFRDLNFLKECNLIEINDSKIMITRLGQECIEERLKPSQEQLAFNF